MRYNHIVIDGNNLFWRSCLSNLKETLDTEKHPLYFKTVSDVLRRIKELKSQFGYDKSKIYMLFDNPLSKIGIRKRITNGKYKHARENKKGLESLYKTLSILIEILKHYSNDYYILQAESLEADDLTMPLLKHINTNKNNDSILFISVDLDWARNITNFSHWFNYSVLYTKENFRIKFGFNPIDNSVKMYKAIHGDSSDNIENAIPRLPNEILLNIVEKYDTIYALIDNLWKTDYPDNWKKRIKEAEVQLKINYQLVDFIEMDKPIDSILYECKEDVQMLKMWFKPLELPFEHRMLDKETITNDFFQQRQV